MIAAADPLLLPAQAASMARMDEWLAAFAAAHNVPDAVREELRVCLHELAANVIMHGAAADAPRHLAISGHATPNRVALEFADDAPAFDPLSRPTGPAHGSIEDVAIGGLGLHLVRSFTDELSYAYTDGWNRLTLVRNITNNVLS